MAKIFYRCDVCGKPLKKLKISHGTDIWKMFEAYGSVDVYPNVGAFICRYGKLKWHIDMTRKTGV